VRLDANSLRRVATPAQIQSMIREQRKGLPTVSLPRR
jgi:hypothetical protein